MMSAALAAYIGIHKLLFLGKVQRANALLKALQTLYIVHAQCSQYTPPCTVCNVYPSIRISFWFTQIMALYLPTIAADTAIVFSPAVRRACVCVLN